MKVFFHTLGCKVNRYETECMCAALHRAGFTDTADAATADVIVVNSCTVTAESDRKTRQLVRRYRRQNETAVIVLTGCMPQAFPADAEALPADIILGNGSERDIVAAVDSYFKSHSRVIKVAAHAKGERFAADGLEQFSGRSRAYMKIEDGCNRGCTYCIIPKARGRVRSRPLDEIHSEAARLAAAGFCEVVLVGINLSSFGAECGLTLADAVETVAGVPGISRIRLGSLEPDLTDDSLLARLKNIPAFCPQFHLSLQSGCDATLKRMNRLYTADDYRRLVQRIRALWDNASITTDIMVGFAGETEAEFCASLAFAEEIGFLKAHIFPYSVREGTAAAGLPDQVLEAEKARRAARMAEACEAAALIQRKAQCGKECEALFETCENGYTEGYSENFTRVFVPERPALVHTVRRVRLLRPMQDGILAELAE